MNKVKLYFVDGDPQEIDDLEVTNLVVSGILTATSIVSSSELWRLSSSGIHTTSNVGIGTTNPTSKLTVFGNVNVTGVITASSFSGNATSATYATSSGISTYASTAGVSTSVVGGIGSITQLQVSGISTFTTGPVIIGSATSTGTASQSLQVTGGAYVSGNLGIGATNPGCSLQINGGVRARGGAPGANGASNNGYAFVASPGDTDSGMFSTADGQINFYINNAESTMFTNGTITIRANSTDEGGQLSLDGGSSYTGYNKNFDVYQTNARLFGPNSWTFQLFSTSAGGTASLSITGALSKGSGSFKIDHPLEELSETHHLVHSFIEGPKADLIYRGKTTLISGISTINIDEVSNMTNGTFDVLCREVQCFTTNETGWTAVKGSVTGNLLTIQAQDLTCTDTISWMVIGERKDKHMFETEWTDDNGKVIVEPAK